MRKLLFAIIFLPALTMAQTPFKFTLKGRVGKLDTPAKAFLVRMNGQTPIVDSVKIQQGRFAFTDTLPEIVSAYLLVDHKGIGYEKLDRSADVLPIYLEKGTIKVKAKDSVVRATVSGSAINKDNKKLQAATKIPVEQLKQIMAKARAATPEQQQQPGFQDSIMAQFSAAQLAYKSIVTAFIKSHPNSYLSLLTLKNLGGQNPEPAEMEPLFNVLSKNIRQSALGQEFKAAIDVLKPTAIGSIAPEFTQADTSGKPIKLSSFRGKYVLIDFWASWCGPCRQENPNVVNAYQKYKDKNFTILGVSLDKTQGAWLNAIKDDNLTWTQVSDLKYWQNAAAALYGVRGIPQNFLIDPDGKIVGKNLRGPALEEKLEELLGKKI